MCNTGVSWLACYFSRYQSRHNTTTLKLLFLHIMLMVPVGLFGLKSLHIAPLSSYVHVLSHFPHLSLTSMYDSVLFLMFIHCYVILS